MWSVDAGWGLRSFPKYGRVGTTVAPATGVGEVVTIPANTKYVQIYSDNYSTHPFVVSMGGTGWSASTSPLMPVWAGSGVVLDVTGWSQIQVGWLGNAPSVLRNHLTVVPLENF